MIYTPKILLFRGRGIASALIRLQTRGAYSHAALQGRDGRIIEAWAGSNSVRSKRIPDGDWDGIDAYLAPGVSGEQWDKALAFANSQLGKKYDYMGVARFVTRRRSRPDDRWFCSELVMEACRVGGFPLLNAPAARVSPETLSWSTVLKKAPKARESLIS